MPLHDTKMRKAMAALLALILACLSALPACAEAAEAEAASYATLLTDMLASYESRQRLDVDAALLDDDVAYAIAEHWKKVYLDPDYHLFLYGTDDPGAVPVSGRHAFVVLGYELKDGEMTEELRGRCDAAVAAALAWPDSILVCSGGATGKNNPDGHTEAGLMKEYLIAHGIEGERVFTDERAMTTAENAVNTFAILREQAIETMTIVTSSYHQRWGQVLYNALAAQYRQEYGYSARIIGNYCYDIEPSNEIFLNDAQIAIRQLGGILGLSEEEMALLPNPLSRGKRRQASLPYWAEGSEALKSVTAFVSEATDPDSDAWIPPSERIVIFDFDGTLYGERFPTYFDNCLFLYRALHDEDYTAAEDVRAYAEALEAALLNGDPEPDSPRSTAQIAAECFAGMTVDEYRAYVRAFMAQPAYGFTDMTYGEGFYLPMVSLVQYLCENDFTIFISSGSERLMVRELIDGTLDTWITPDRVIGSTFSLTATHQGDQQGRSYTYAQDDEVLMEGNLVVKNQKANKVFSIVDEIGMPPVMVFGNSSGDIAMAEYCIQHGGMAWMLLCDDVERDYGDPDAAAAFAEECRSRGIGTISMRDDFSTIYGEIKTALRKEEHNHE